MLGLGQLARADEFRRFGDREAESACGKFFDGDSLFARGGAGFAEQRGWQIKDGFHVMMVATTWDRKCVAASRERVG